MNDQKSSLIHGKALRLALAIGAAYALFGMVWILVSDELVTTLSSDPAWASAAQRYKGLFYVLTTAMGLVALVRLGNLRLLKAAADSEQRELQVQDLFLRHPKPMWVYDQGSLAFLKVNEAACRDYGYSEAEFLAMTLSDLGPQGPAETATDTAMASPFAAEPAPAEGSTVRYRKKSGELVHVHTTTHAVRYGGRNTVMAMASDMSREVLSRRALQRQEAQFRQLHQSLGEVLWLADAASHEVLYVSPAFESVYGQAAEAFKKNPGLWLDVVHPQDRATAAASNHELMSSGQSSCEYRVCRPDGTLRWVADRKKLIVDEDGLVSLIGGIAEDITATKERDAARATTQAELERMVAERTAELERVNAELDAFTRTAAHDLKTPLNGIAGFSHLLHLKCASVLDESGIRMVTQIERSARHMETLVNDLLTLSRATTAALALKPVDLVPLALEIVDELRRNEPRRVVSFVAPPTLHAVCDAGLARALLSNLLGNAWKFTGHREHGQICLATRPSPRGCVISVGDNGAGFDIDQSAGLFKPFQRFHPAHQFSGTGIGLATCQRIVHRHGGQIWARSRVGEGATFFFTLAAETAHSLALAEETAPA